MKNEYYVITAMNYNRIKLLTTGTDYEIFDNLREAKILYDLEREKLSEIYTIENKLLFEPSDNFYKINSINVTIYQYTGSTPEILQRSEAYFEL